MNAATRALRAEGPPGLHALAGCVMDVARAEVRLGRLLPLADPERDLRIAESAAAKVLRQAADTVPGARAATCRLLPEDEGTDVRVTMTLAAALDRPLPRPGPSGAPIGPPLGRTGPGSVRDGRRHHRDRRPGAGAAPRFRPPDRQWYVMTAIRTTTLLGVAAEAALAVPGVVGLQPRLAYRLAAAAAPTRTDTTPHRTSPKAGIRADRAPDGSGWHIEVRRVLGEGQRALKHRPERPRPGAETAVISRLAALGVTERGTVEVTVTRIAARHDAA